jgi:hypothetical protein
MELIKHNYNGSFIHQKSNDGYVNLTEMASTFDKKVNDYIRLKSTDEYLEALSSDTGISASQLIISTKGNFSDGRTQGTWAHKLIAVDFARWLSPSFAVWANTHLLELMETGTTSLEIKQPEPNSTKELIELTTLAIDCIFSRMHIEEALVAGLKLNAIKELAPAIAPQIESTRQLLINSTATDAKLMTVTELGKLHNPPLSAIKMNQLLLTQGYQIKNPKKKSQKDLSYIPTDKAKDHCSITLATGNSKEDTYQQLRWYDSILSLV